MSLFVHPGTKTKQKLKRISTGSRETMSQFTNVKQSLACYSKNAAQLLI